MALLKVPRGEQPERSACGKGRQRRAWLHAVAPLGAGIFAINAVKVGSTQLGRIAQEKREMARAARCFCKRRSRRCLVFMECLAGNPQQGICCGGNGGELGGCQGLKICKRILVRYVIGSWTKHAPSVVKRNLRINFGFVAALVSRILLAGRVRLLPREKGAGPCLGRWRSRLRTGATRTSIGHRYGVRIG